MVNKGCLVTPIMAPSPLVKIVNSPLLPGTGEGDKYTNGNFLYEGKTCALFFKVFPVSGGSQNNPYAKEADLGGGWILGPISTSQLYNLGWLSTSHFTIRKSCVRSYLELELVSYIVWDGSFMCFLIIL